MKRLFILLCMLAVCLTSCDQTRKEAIAELKQAVNELNEELPMDISYFTWEKAAIKGKYYIVYLTLDETKYDWVSFLADLNNRKRYIATSFAPELLVEAGLGFKAIATGNPSHRQGEATLSAKEIKDMIPEIPRIMREEATEAIHDAVIESQATLPQDCGGGFILVAMGIEDNYVCYTYETGRASVRQVKQNKANIANLEDYVIEDLNGTNDQEAIHFLNNVIQAEMGIKYIYMAKGSSEKETITLSPETIQAKLKSKDTD